MFLHDTHLPQILDASDYVSEDQFVRETERLFRPAWHCVGSLHELPKTGDYLTRELLGRPIIVWRTEAGVRAFLNVCPHRFSVLSRFPKGHCGERLTCQYHGWQFDETGNTRRIPDARSFKPLEAGQLCLTPYRTEVCGTLIFVCEDPAAPDLAAFLGDGYETTRKLFSSEYRPCLSLDYDLEVDWKVKVENTLESYHVECVHPKTFSHMPVAEVCTHELQPRWTTFAADEPAPTARDRFLDRLIHAVSGVPLDTKYVHFIYYPHVMYGKLRMLSWIETLWPVAPGRCRVMFRSFCNPGSAGRIRSTLAYLGVRSYARNFGTIASAEDAAVMPGVQRGLRCPVKPSTGLLSVREERLFHFQQYVLEATTDGPAADDAAGTDGTTERLRRARPR